MIFPLLDYFEKQIQEVSVSSSNNSSETKDDDDCTGTITTQATLLRDVNEARYKLLRPTHMVDYMMDVYNNSIIIHGNTNDSTKVETVAKKDSVHQEMTQQKQQVLQDLESLKQQCLPLLEEIDAATRVRMPSISNSK